ncbi:sugar-binding transcriptional regulator [Cryptosporangium sp. NPDC051539]|uniref:sugar-binding transcriptional regulator n=1 Tax=Cryptosporangium sp. NPDC051539 TaxID=3363962 RepID=UPI0037993901
MSDRPVAPAEGARFSLQLMYAAAKLYYLQDSTQAEIADQLGTSRATVSRLLSEARRLGIVRIEVVEPGVADVTGLAERTAAALGLDAVHLSAFPAGGALGTALAPAVSRALQQVGLVPGDVLLVSSGRTIYEVAQVAGGLPELPGVLVAPTVGGQDEPEPWYQTNELTRLVAAGIGGSPVFLYAPALPGPELHERLLDDPSIRRVTELWTRAKCALLGVGAPPPLRGSLPSFVDAGAVGDAAGDVATRFYDRDGASVDFPGADRLVATPLDVLKAIPVAMAVAVGGEKVPGIIAGARAGYFNHLATDPPTALAALAAART